MDSQPSFMGLKNTRKVVESTEKAGLDQRMTNLDNRLMGEIAFAAGYDGRVCRILCKTSDASRRIAPWSKNIRMAHISQAGGAIMLNGGSRSRSTSTGCFPCGFSH